MPEVLSYKTLLIKLDMKRNVVSLLLHAYKKTGTRILTVLINAYYGALFACLWYNNSFFVLDTLNKKIVSKSAI